MLDNSAFEVAGYNPLAAGAPAPGGDDGCAGDSTAATALAGCAACQKAIGDCAFHYARTGALSPSLAVSICDSMQRLARIAWTARAANSSSYLAYVWLGPARSAFSPEDESARLAERIW